MAYDPALFSFIIVGVVGGVAVVMSASSNWEITHELARATDDWTSPLVMRTYPGDPTAQQAIAREAAVLGAHGYKAVLRRELRRAGPSEASGSGAVARATSGRGTPAGSPPTAQIVIHYRLG